MTTVSSPKEIRLPSTGAPATQVTLPQGVLRTVLQPSAKNQPPADLAIRYDEKRLAFVKIHGALADQVGPEMMTWLWEHLPQNDAMYSHLEPELTKYLNGDARALGEGDDAHSIVLGVVDRTLPQGKIWLGWIGSGGIRILDPRRELQPVDVGLFPGEAWTPKDGIYPDNAKLHVEQFAINSVDRLLVFSTSLRGIVDEVPFLGRSALQRLAEARANDGAVVLFDLHPHMVIPAPSKLGLHYRWESPTTVNLSWTGGDDATSFTIEESLTPEFEEAKLIAELTDHRQRVYTVRPPSDYEVYYRVVPANKDVRGEPSTPVIVTPVPVYPPQIDEISWGTDGNIRVQWTLVPQADIYELEFSPSQDFDSPQTSIVYRGESTMVEIDREVQPAGWFFRVRSRNSQFNPKVVSLWGSAKRAPHRLVTPVFRTVSPSVISWMPINGVHQYQIRQITQTDRSIIATVDREKFVPPPGANITYQVRAMRRADDELTASEWSNAVTIGASDIDILDFDTPIPGINDDSDTVPLTVGARPPNPTSTVGTSIMLLVGVGLLTMVLGLLAGLVGGPQLGIGIDPSPTPLSSSEVQATATQLTLNRENAIARTTLTSELNRVNIVATENANQLANLQTRDANLLQENNANIAQQATLGADMANLESTALAVAEYQATLENDVYNLGIVATENAASINGLQLTATAAANGQQIMLQEIENLQGTIEALPTPTPNMPLFGKADSTLPLSAWLVALVQQLEEALAMN